jgi:uncharacterized protein YabN with tetrapyrrole methylase and pyrophosphatase domain
MQAFARLLDVLDELRQKCPWDKKQTNESLRPNTIEETFELADAIMRGDSHDMMKELGDVLMHTCFYAMIAREQGLYDIADVLNTETDKLIFRHPHVYQAPTNLPPRGRLSEETKVLDRYRLANPSTYNLLKEYSKENKKKTTEAEAIVWELLRNKRMGVTFRRQHVIGDFIVDFISLNHQLAIEIDGDYHLTPEQQKADQMRTSILSDLGFREIRFSNEEVIAAPTNVSATIRGIIECERIDGLKSLPFGGRLEGAAQVLKNWEQIKLREKDGNKTVLSGVPASLPSLIKAYRIQDKARNVGFDWQKKEDVWAKVHEELAELEAELAKTLPDDATDEERARLKAAQEGELGDFIFSVINAARLYHLNPDNALEQTNQKFIHRFNYIEEHSIRAGKPLTDMTLEEMDRLWNEAKKIED